MSIRHRLRKVGGDDGFGSYPRLVIEVEGIDDEYRIARALEGHQVEFSELARDTLIGLDRRWPGVVLALVRRMGPHDTWRYAGRRPRGTAIDTAEAPRG